MDLGDAALFLGAISVVIGHNWPVFLGFRGGKGVASMLGISLAVLPIWTLAGMGAAVVAGVAGRSVVFGIAVGIVVINALTITTGQDAVQVSMCLTLSAIVVAVHYGMAFREVRESVRRRGLWGIFEQE